MSRFLVVVATIAVISLGNAVAQTNVNEEQGLKPYDAWHGGDLDSISLTSGSLVLHIPVASFPQRGILDLSFFLRYSGKQWQVYSGNHWGGAPGAAGNAEIVSSLDWRLQAQYGIAKESSWDHTSLTFTAVSFVISPDGNTHQFWAGSSDTSSPPTGPMRSIDSSGLLVLPATNGSNYIVFEPNGVQHTNWSFGLAKFGRQAATVTDPNGNQITLSANGWTDTMGRVIPGTQQGSQVVQPGAPTSDLSNCPSGTVSAWVWNVPGVAGVNNGIRTFKFCYATVTLSTNFQQSGITEFSGTATLLSAVVLPDLTMWTLSYDSYGNVTRLGFPTGGSISYTYITRSLPCPTAATTMSRWVATRSVDANDGGGPHTWQYNYSGQIGSNGYSGTTTVTSPDLNDVVHTIVSPVQGAECSLFDTQAKYYQGSANSGTLLKTTATQYTGIVSPYNGVLNDSNVAADVVATQSSVTFPGGQTGKTATTYDSGNTNPDGTAVIVGSVLQKDEYDFSNSLARSAVNHYLWQDNSAYKNNNLVELLASSTLKDGSGNQVAQTTYGYDQATPVASGIGTPTHVAPPAGEPIRGNRTTTSHWLDSSNSLLSSTATYFDTGMLASSTPPPNADGKNRTTTYTYDPAFLGAYVTQTNMPDTQMPDSGAAIVHHVISGNYDFNTGLLTSFTDENGQPFTYQYDVMLRLTQGNHPDGGVTKFNYPDPNTVERQRLITGSTYDDYKVKFDGLGRAYETQQLTPDCASYIKVDTTFDSMGRVATVSNPYCLTSEPTYGITQTQYDALGRTTKTIKQDGSASTVQNNAAAGDGAGSSVICTTATDEAGKQRQVCNDALGRMAKVMEPNPSAPATNATGWVSFSGTEQSANSQPAASGTGTITISGAEQHACGGIRTCTPYIYDAGTVTVSVASYPAKSVPYGKLDTPATIAYALSCAFHNDASSPVDAPCPASAGTSTTVNLTARTTGASTNYSFTSSSATSDTSCTNFCSPSFSAAPASGALTGGQNASTAPDSGTVSVTINGSQYSTNFGSGDTPTSIAGRLAPAISAGSWANATPSSGTISLTSKMPGTVGDYSLAAAYTWNSGQFINPSFTTSVSGSALSGALDAGAVNNNPFVTTYQYNARSDMLCVHQKATDTSPDAACTGTSAPTVPAAWRQRFFTYDSLSRILTAMNPESNSTGSTAISYGYDADGNMITKTEPAPNRAWGSSSTVTISYSYDALNRLLDTTYSDGTTPTASHRYDYSSFLGQTFAYPIGREVATMMANNTPESFLSYDQMGRVAATTQCNPGVTGCKTFTAAYDKIGDLTSLAYPGNGFTMTYGYDSAARLTSATDSNGANYAQNPTFLASGAIKEFTSPNFNGIKYHVDYNNRLQPIEIWTGSSQGSTALFDKQYSYNAPNTSQMNNGNIYTVTNVVDGTRTQTFTYDSLNRLVSAGDQSHWSNTYSYDPWGNLFGKNPGSPAGENLSQTADTNNHLSGLSCDAAGNEISDRLGGSFTYDAENRMTTAAGVNYTYDADGRRIKKSSGTYYWYGPGGGALAETDSSGNWTNYVFFGGQRLARNVSGDIKYYITDHLHSTAMFVDKAGTTAAVLDDNDFYPWGGVVPGVGKTTSNNTIKFTGKERDSETGLDYFGARYYSNGLGRFITPDWSATPVPVPYADLTDPQTLNQYSYVRNIPTVRADTDGHCPDCGIVQIPKSVAELDQQNQATTQGWIGVAKSVVNFEPSLMNSFITMGESGSTPIPLLQPSNESQAAGMAFGSAGTTVVSAIVGQAEVGSSTTSQLQGAANRAAESVGPGSGPVHGTEVHTEFASEVKSLGKSNLSTEVSYKNGAEVARGTKGSIRADVVEGPKNAPKAAYDLKTGNAKLTQTRVQQIQKHVPGGSKVPVKEIKPQ